MTPLHGHPAMQACARLTPEPSLQQQHKRTSINFLPQMIASRTKLLLLAGLAVSAISLWLTWRATNMAKVGHDLTDHIDYRFALPFLVAYGVFFWIKALRWRLLLTPVSPATVRQLFPTIIIGYAGNLIFPMQAGEILRTYLLGHQLKIKNSPILTTIVLERILDFLVIFVFLAAVLLTSSHNEFPSLRTAGYITGILALCGLAIPYLYLYHTRLLLDYCRRLTAFFPTRFHNYLLMQLERGAPGLESFRSPRLLGRVVTASFVMWAVMALATYIAIRALDIDVPFSAAVVVLIFTVIGFTLPSGPGYVGTVQLSFLLALAPYEVASDAAVAASIFYHVLITIPPLALALVISIRLGYTPVRLWRTMAAASRSGSTELPKP